jgi:hypothetical protein
VKSKTEQKLSIAGTDVDTSSDSRIVTRVNVGQRDAEGKLRVEEKTEALAVSVVVQGQNYTFDSTNPDAAGSSPLEVLREMHKALVGRTTTKVFDKFDRPIAVETDASVVDKLPTQVRNLVRSEFDAEQLRISTSEELDQITTDPVKPGDSWKRTRTANFGAGQYMTLETEFTYQGTEEKGGKTLDKIVPKVLSVKFAIDNSPLPLTLVSSDLKPASTEGTILFDRERGQVVETDTKIRITGDMKFKVNDMELPATLDLTMHSQVALQP